MVFAGWMRSPLVHLSLVISESDLRLEERDGGCVLVGPAASRFAPVDEYLAHLADRNYSP
jgi:integrase/recombinase XerD